MSHDNFQHLNSKAQKARTLIAISVFCNCVMAFGAMLLWTASAVTSSGSIQIGPMVLRLVMQSADTVFGLLAGIFFLIWQNAAIKNAKKLNPKVMKTSTSWAVWSWIIPVISIFKPYLVMKEIWAATVIHPDMDETELPQPLRNTLMAWWLIWLLPTTIGVGVVAALGASGIRGSEEIVMACFKAGGVIVSGLMIMQIITRITMDQDRAFAQRQLNTTAGTVAKPLMQSDNFQDNNANDAHTIHLNKPNTIER